MLTCVCFSSVISKVVPNSEPKTPGTKTPAAKSAPGNRPRTPPPPPVLPPVVPILPPASPLQPAPVPPGSLLPLPSMLPPAASVKPPVRSVVTETVSTYVVGFHEWSVFYRSAVWRIMNHFALKIINRLLESNKSA